MLVTLDATVGRVMCITRGTEEASMPTKVLEKMLRSRRAVIELLLMWLEVGARHGPCNFRRRPRQQKLWHARNCSSIFLLLQKSSTSGKPPSGASSASPTKMSRDQLGP